MLSRDKCHERKKKESIIIIKTSEMLNKKSAMCEYVAQTQCNSVKVQQITSIRNHNSSWVSYQFCEIPN